MDQIMSHIELLDVSGNQYSQHLKALCLIGSQIKLIIMSYSRMHMNFMVQGVTIEHTILLKFLQEACIQLNTLDVILLKENYSFFFSFFLFVTFVILF